MGWMNDTLAYVKTDPIYKRYEHNKITFQLTYIFSEKFVLALSHDEVVHGKLSLINRMPGDYNQKFAGMRLYMMYMISHPGKKLIFMGGEIGQFIEWRDDREIDWLLLEYENHQQLQKFNADLNHFYLEHSEFYERDDNWSGFEWLNADDKDRNIFTYKRRNNLEEEIIVLLNFSNACWDNYYVYVEDGEYEILLHSDDIQYGGSTKLESSKIQVINGTMIINVPPISGIYLRKVK
jgi:1,4-alpha-glucan branching enzyme